MPSTPALPFELPPPEDGQPPDLLVIAGEHSGDQHAARLIERARARQPGLRVAALGGPEMAAAGAQLLLDMTAFSVVGIFEVLRNYGFFKELFQKTLDWVEKYLPKAICFVDYPGFNLRLAEALHEKKLTQKAGGDVNLLYYISPQIWAWKGKRRFKMAEYLDSLAVIFPFELESYADTRLDPVFVGHPFVAEGAQLPVRYDPGAPVLLLPGSRTAAVGRIYPRMLDAYDALRRSGEERPAVTLYPSAPVREKLESALYACPNLDKHVTLKIVGETKPQAASAVLTSSGTMSLACALAGVPGVIVYRAHPLTYLVGRRLVSIAYLGISNLLLKRDSYPEYLQGDANRYALLRELRHCLHNPKRQQQAASDAQELRHLLGEGDHNTAIAPEDWLLQCIAR